MSAPSLEYLRLCGLLLLPVAFLATLSAPGSSQAPLVRTPTVPPNAATINLLAYARRDHRVERVARAICILKGIDPDHQGPPFPDGPIWEFYIPDAVRFLTQLDAAMGKEK